MHRCTLKCCNQLVQIPIVYIKVNKREYLLSFMKSLWHYITLKTKIFPPFFITYLCSFSAACVYGDPHIVSLDGHKYTFNGKGEFVIIQTSTNIFALQGRMEQVLDAAENPSPGTVFTAIVARQISSNISVQFEVNSIDRSLLVLVNGDEAVFENLAVIEFQDVVLLDKGNDTVQALFSSGANVEISVLNGIISIMLVALPESMKRTTGGLMGPYNDIISDDFTPKGGGSALPLDDSLENIHTNFGKTC